MIILYLISCFVLSKIIHVCRIPLIFHAVNFFTLTIHHILKTFNRISGDACFTLWRANIISCHVFFQYFCWLCKKMKETFLWATHIWPQRPDFQYFDQDVHTFEYVMRVQKEIRLLIKQKVKMANIGECAFAVWMSQLSIFKQVTKGTRATSILQVLPRLFLVPAFWKYFELLLTVLARHL